MILIRHKNEGQLKPFFYFALEQYVLQNLLKGDDTYFFTWEIKGVVVGKNQVLENEINIDYLKANNIAVYRRPTGGGCVYADHRNTMFSIVTKKANKEFSFRDYLKKIIDSMKILEIDLEFSGRNDLLFKGKKISGNAFLQNKYGMLMHGTFLYDCDLETMVRAISPSNEKLVSKGIASVRSRVTNLKPHLGDMTQNQLIKHFENTLTNKTYYLSEKEVFLIKEMAKKYESIDWIYKKQPRFTKILKKRIPGGLIEIRLELDKGVIKNLKIQGDFFDQKPLKDFENTFTGLLYTKNNIDDVLKNNAIETYILDADTKSFAHLLYEGILE